MPNTQEVIIRKARPPDYAQACRLFDALDQLHRERAPWMFKTPPSQPRSEDFFADLLNNEDAVVFVADVGSLVGLAHGLMRTAPDIPVFVNQRWGVVEGLLVDPAWRRRGIGRRLTEAIEEWANGLGAAWVELNVYDFNAEAREFYGALGYLPLSTKLRKLPV